MEAISKTKSGKHVILKGEGFLVILNIESEPRLFIALISGINDGQSLVHFPFGSAIVCDEAMELVAPWFSSKVEP